MEDMCNNLNQYIMNNKNKKLVKTKMMGMEI